MARLSSQRRVMLELTQFEESWWSRVGRLWHTMRAPTHGDVPMSAGFRGYQIAECDRKEIVEQERRQV